MTPMEQRQQATDDAWKWREEWERFRPVGSPAAPTPIRPTPRDTAQEAYAHPILGPLMVEEDEREREGEPPRFSLLP